jgi:hypothetical protein
MKKYFVQAVFALLLVTPVWAASCSASPEPEDADEHDGPEPTGDREDAVFGGTVAEAAAQTCSTGSVKGLSEQIIAEGNCLAPGAYATVPERPNLTFNANVFPYLETPARDALVKALDAVPGQQMTVASMLRTVAQQYMLYRWYQGGRCGIQLAAKPGNSNHETGLALDISQYGSWKSALQARGFKWLGESDRPHFDYAGAGAVSHKGVDVEAFQRLWNRNHPEDPIGEDGEWGPQTEARMKKSPASGFAKGAECDGGGSTGGGETTTGGGEPDPPPQGCGPYTGSAAYKCAPDGAGRGKCVNGSAVVEPCANGCLIKDGADDVCMGSTSTWSCSGSYGTSKMEDGNYYATSFGCWVDGNGDPQSDPGDNCVPACLAQAQSSGLCAGETGPECERAVKWFAADAGRFGCLARLRVTNPVNGKSLVVTALDKGPACWVEDQVDDGVLDLSYPATNYLFGDQVGVVEKKAVHVVEVDPTTPLGPL